MTQMRVSPATASDRASRSPAGDLSINQTGPVQLHAKDLVVMRGGRRVIDGLSFTASAGEAWLLTGRNGSGKTTLIRTLAGFLAPVSGTVSLDGFDPERDYREACHYVGHLDANKASLTVIENLRFWQSYLGEGASDTKADAVLTDPDGDGLLNGQRYDHGDARLQSALEQFELDTLSDIPAGYLSAGQKRRLGLARLVVARRPVWLLDEPTVSLDTQSTVLLAGVIDAHVAAGGIVIAATHLPLGLGAARELRLGASSAGEIR